MVLIRQFDTLVDMNNNTLIEYYQNKTILVTGGAGFIGSHLVERLLSLDCKVIAVDVLITGNANNLKNFEDNPAFSFIKQNVSVPVSEYLNTKIDAIFHFASPASPVGYIKNPEITYMVNAMATHHLAVYAIEHNIPILFASTSEVYGDPEQHPQPEEYWGNVNPIGIRSCYDVSKRFGEMVLTTKHRTHNLESKIVRIFNTYGPRMDINDGRVIPNFISQALKNEPITVHGDGSQTRSLCFVSDLVEFILRNMAHSETVNLPINIGNDHEVTILELAEKIRTLTGSHSEIVNQPRPADDPTVRRPQLDRAKKFLDYTARVDLETGLKQTIEYFQSVLEK